MRLFLFGMCLFACTAFADLTVTMYSTTSNQKKSIGTIIFKDTKFGLMIIPDLHGLSPGSHGFHLHDHPSCLHQAKDAAGHFDPQKTRKHLGPYGNKGHLGDLPALFADKQGNAILPIVAPRLRESDLYGHAVIIHAGGDNYSDQPKPLGGGGDRIACAVIKNSH